MLFGRGAPLRTALVEECDVQTISDMVWLSLAPLLLLSCFFFLNGAARGRGSQGTDDDCFAWTLLPYLGMNGRRRVDLQNGVDQLGDQLVLPRGLTSRHLRRSGGRLGQK